MVFPVCVVILDKFEATCIRQVEGYWKDVSEIGRSSSGNRAGTQRRSILGTRTPPNTYLSSELRVVLYCLEVEGVERFTRCSLFLFPPISCFIMSRYPEVCPYFVRCIPGRSFQFTSPTRANTGTTTMDTRPPQ